jgi:hypothetical protein
MSLFESFFEDGFELLTKLLTQNNNTTTEEHANWTSICFPTLKTNNNNNNNNNIITKRKQVADNNNINKKLKIKELEDIEVDSLINIKEICKHENPDRNPVNIQITHDKFNNLSFHKWHIGYGSSPIQNIKTIIDDYKAGLLDIEVYKASYIREMIVSCGLIKIQYEKINKQFFIPGCVKGMACIGYSGVIDGISPDLKGVTFRALLSPKEWKYIMRGKMMQYSSIDNTPEVVDLTQEALDAIVKNRRCLLDEMAIISEHSIQQSSHPHKVIIPEDYLIQIGSFLFDEEEGYKSGYRHELSSVFYEGVLCSYPNFNLSNMYFYYRHDVNLWALDMRKIEYNPSPLSGFLGELHDDIHATKPWSIDDELWKLNSNINNNNNNARQIQLLQQMRVDTFDDNPIHKLAKTLTTQTNTNNSQYFQ